MNNKLLKIAGGLFILSVCGYIVFIFAYPINYFYVRLSFIALIISSICLIIHCFYTKKREIRTVFYYLGLGVLLLAYTFSLIGTREIDLLIKGFFVIAAIACFVAVKIKPNKYIAIIGTIILSVYLLLTSVESIWGFVFDLKYFEYIGIMYFLSELVYLISLNASIAAYILIWIGEVKLCFTKAEVKNAATERIECVDEFQGGMSIEDELLNLKRAFENGEISIEKYADERSKILSKL